jgi:hypothetical protein
MVWFTELAMSLGLSDLQLSLGMIGFSLLVLVMIYNAMRIRKLDKNESMDDSSEPSEPSFSLADGVLSKSEPSLGGARPTITQAVLAKIDPLIDCVASLRLPEPITGQEILSHSSDWPKNTQFTWILEGLSTDGVWQSITPEKTFTELQLAIQLANRSGPIGMVDLSDFVSKAQLLSNALDAELDLAPHNDIIESAKSLDEFAAKCDIQLGITVVPKNGLWNLMTIQTIANKAGFLLSRDGREYQRIVADMIIYKLVADQANFLRDDSSVSNVQYVTLLLNLPHVSHELAPEMSPFQLMLDDAKILAEALNGHLVDDAGRPLVDGAITAIQGQLEDIYQAMTIQGIPAGSAAASRLFS